MASTKSRQDSRHPFRLIINLWSTAAEQQTQFVLEWNPGLGAEPMLGHAQKRVRERRTRNRIRAISWLVSTLFGMLEPRSAAKGVRQEGAP